MKQRTVSCLGLGVLLSFGLFGFGCSGDDNTVAKTDGGKRDTGSGSGGSSGSIGSGGSSGAGGAIGSGGSSGSGGAIGSGGSSTVGGAGGASSTGASGGSSGSGGTPATGGSGDASASGGSGGSIDAAAVDLSSGPIDAVDAPMDVAIDTAIDANVNDTAAVDTNSYDTMAIDANPYDVMGIDNAIDATVASYRVKTTYSEGSIPFYMVDCVQAGTITRLNETDHVTPSDFFFHITPGLANPNDPSLVSFESVSNPGYYLRIDSANLTSATRAVTTGAYAWDMNFAYDHLTWFDAFADTTAFKSDATFKKTAALNGDTTMVSLQWYSDNTRYLRHMNYHVFALLPATSQDHIDSSFVFEVQP